MQMESNQKYWRHPYRAVQLEIHGSGRLACGIGWILNGAYELSRGEFEIESYVCVVSV